jgi:hypothetical protein
MRPDIFIVFLALWGTAIWRHGLFKADLPTSYRIQTGCLSLLLICSSAAGIRFFIWSLFHPNLLSERYYVQMGVFPPLVTLLVIMLSTGAGFFKLFIGFDIVKQRRRARTLAARCIPFLAAADILNVAVWDSGSAMAHPMHHLIASIDILLHVGFYFWLYRFCRDSRTEQLMTR